MISLTYIFSGINIFRYKDFFLIIENTFIAILYSIIGSLFLSYFYPNSFIFYVNGNGGFIGNYFNQSFLNSIIRLQENTFYYCLILVVIILFLKSINFNNIKFLKYLKKLFKIFFNKNEKSYTDKSELISEYIPQDEIKNLIQEDLPFIKADKQINKKQISITKIRSFKSAIKEGKRKFRKK